MNSQPILGAVVGMFAGGTLGILALTVVTNSEVAVTLAFAGGMVIIGSLFVLAAISRR